MQHPPTPNAERIAHAHSSHWPIENSRHWMIDVAFDEDQCRVSVANAAQNLGILRRIVMNRFKRDTAKK